MHQGVRPFPAPYRGRGRRRQPESPIWAASATSAIWDDGTPPAPDQAQVMAMPSANWATTNLVADQNWNLPQATSIEPDMDSPDDSITIEDDEMLKGRNGLWGQVRYEWITKGLVPYREWKDRTRPSDVLSSLSEMVEILSKSWRHLQAAQQGDQAEEPEQFVPESVQRRRRREYYRNRRRR